jgi:dTDP-4-dehydrorhamnose 3,5-epimerase
MEQVINGRQAVSSPVNQIEGVVFIPKKRIIDERGSVMHHMRADSPEFKGFGEVYMSTVKSGVIKAWKRHMLMWQSFTVPMGRILFVLHDTRPHSSSQGVSLTYEVGESDYGLLQIPPLVWYGFRGLSEGESLIVNCASIPHEPSEVERLSEESDLMPNFLFEQRLVK